MISGFNVTTLGLIVFGVAYLGLAIVSFLRRNFRDTMAYALALYAAVAVFWKVWEVIGQLGGLAFLRPEFVARIPLYSALTLAVMFYYLTRAFLRLDANGWRYWLGLGVGSVWLAALLVLDANPFNLPDILLSGAGWVVARLGVVLVGLVVGWAGFSLVAAWLTYRAFQQTEQALHHNRLLYWLPALALIVFGNGLLSAQQALLGEAVHFAGVLIAGYVTLVHHLPDMRRNARRVTVYVLVTLLSALLYLAVFGVAEFFLPQLPGYTSLVSGAAIAALLAASALNLLLSLLQRGVVRVITGSRYDARQTLSEYSAQISNIVELERLAEVALNLIKEALAIQRGTLFRVDLRRTESGEEQYTLRSIGTLQGERPALGTILATSPIAQHLITQYTALTQYDIDLLPRFEATPIEEFKWLSQLAMDVYVPIYAKNKWIGLLALGPKTSRDRYYDDDLGLLNTLADQTAIAFENARLFDDLVGLNQNLREAYGKLDEANQQLGHLDKAKSNFINIVSHELRTPLTIMLGYSEILVADPSIAQNPMQKQMVAGMYNGATRLREIIESMFDVAKIDSRTLVLTPQPIPVMMLVKGVSDLQEKVLTERKLKLMLDDNLRALPAIEADIEALRKVFRNLLLNAIKYTPDGGTIRIYGQQPSAHEIQITVQDTGIGIEARFQELIFTKFYQTGEVALHSSGQTKFKGGGPGLGLAIVRGVIEAHGGRAWVESPGYNEQTHPGSRFHVVLPIKHQRTIIETLKG